VELSPSWEATSCSVIEEFLNILWNQKVNYRVHKSPPPAPVLSQINPVRTSPFRLFKIIFNIIICLGVLSGLFHFGFSTKTLYEFLYPHACYMPRPSNPPSLDHFKNTYIQFNIYDVHICINRGYKFSAITVGYICPKTVFFGGGGFCISYCLRIYLLEIWLDYCKANRITAAKL
jgi:hypothetical protein